MSKKTDKQNEPSKPKPKASSMASSSAIVDEGKANNVDKKNLPNSVAVPTESTSNNKPPTSAAYDLALVRRVQAGEKAAFDLLVLKYQNRVIKLVMRFLADASEAQDVAQEAFIKAYKALPRFRGDSAFYTWLYRIAVNTAKNYLVARGRRPRTFSSVGSKSTPEGETFDPSILLTSIETPDRLAMKDQLEKAIRTAMDNLPEDLRVAVSLREYDGMSYEDIAMIMDCPIGTVRSRIFRAREAIERHIHQFLEDTE